MKKILVFTVIMAAFLLLLAGCSVNNGNPGEIETTTQLNDEKIYEIEVPVGDSVSSFTFDENNNLLSHNNPGTNSEAELVNYSYDSRGNCICISWF
ncbi:MAG: membrane lipoprotein lipid attachment site-containing protein, partial [Clostridia bacterium]|nr:membrane lipoprotein lipid attachment site-containing protein [Clostridia bacterium]